MGFQVAGVAKSAGVDLTGSGDVAPKPVGDASSALRAWLVRKAKVAPFHLQVWAADTDAGNRLAASAANLEAELRAALPREALLAHAGTARDQGRDLAQAVIFDARTLVWGTVTARDAYSLAPGGRLRIWREEGPSRAALKLEEAFATWDAAPGRGELCADLGAAPGGWTQRLAARGARVWAVDTGALRPEIARLPKVKHFQQSAFEFVPEEPVDWLFCDMAWRPLEVAQLLAKWRRRRWASQLIANFKLPMQDKVAMLARIRPLLEDAGWKRLKIRQLYHDRDEVTVYAVER